ncbi:chemotaxis protein CheW [Tenuifilum thalassicum]|uniref:Chemotaxis protein CheW n=1 Tax=Tenuifilum thalassicum TaxID=2590900 RepID=A0A7D4AX64_9BACT|nr:chemotaxis protein CheW [Tenuifilum thalassicum]QKG79954.1 chemotaxis protein CheW [Tenuifilum thalassicum]
MGSYIIFQLDETDYGIPISQIKQLDVMGKVTPVPNAPQYVEGIVLTRGEVIPAINIRKKYGLPNKDFNLKTRLIHIYSNERSFGLIVDSAREFINIDDDQILPPPKKGNTPFTNEITGVVKHGERIILILNPLELAVDENKPITESEKSPKPEI